MVREGNLMVELTSEEAKLALVALQHTVWRLKAQTKEDGMVRSCTDAAWFCAKYCIEEFEAIIRKLEQSEWGAL